MKDLISVVLPVYNEAAHLRDVIASLLRQRMTIAPVEILVIDGMSTDGSYEIAQSLAQSDSRVRVFRNERRTTPCAFNIGLAHAAGQYVAILGAHCEYDDDYLNVCLKELLQHDAAGCSGRVISRAPSSSLQARLSLWVMSHPFGVSGSSFRTQSEGYVDTIPYPVFIKQALLDVGGYDEQMTRNQDNDMNYKLGKAGHKLYLTWKTKCMYFTRRNLAGLFNYARTNGSWCAVSFLTEPRSLGLRHYVPAMFALTVIHAGVWLTLATILGGWVSVISLIAALPLLAHLVVGALAGISIYIKEKRAAALLLPPIFFAFHFVYGFGFLARLQKALAFRLARVKASVSATASKP